MNREQFKEYNRLHLLLNRTDYKVLKFIEGEISAEEFEPIKQERAKARARIRELEGK